MRTITRLALLVASAFVVLVAAASASAAATCHGLTVTTHRHAGLVQGTPGRDIILLTGAGTVQAGAGDDLICGSKRADVIDGGPGSDLIVAGAGADRITGGTGRDRIFGEAGVDRIDGGSGRDVVSSGSDRRIRPRQLGDYADGSAFGISLYIQPSSLEALMESESTIGIIRSASYPAPVWATLTMPLMMNAITWPGPYAAWASGNGALFPGMQVSPQSTLETSLGSGASWDGSGGLSATAGAQSNAITVFNNTFQQISAGLSQAVVVDGRLSGAPQPQTATALYGQMAGVFKPTQTVTLFATQQPVQPGLLAFSAQQFGQTITVTLTPTNPTARIAYDIDGGFTTDAP